MFFYRPVSQTNLGPEKWCFDAINIYNATKKVECYKFLKFW